MMWKEVKSWATSHGYKVCRTKIEGMDQRYIYQWEEKSDPINIGRADSVFNLAKQVYNSITKGKHVDHQNNYDVRKDFEQSYKKNNL